MNSTDDTSSAVRGPTSEWRNHFMLPVAGALGYATSVIHIYGFGPYIEPLEESFGWSRSLIAFGLTIATVINGVLAIFIGMLVDRMGPRRVGLAGILLTSGAFALVGTADGSAGNWYLLWTILACATLPVQATIWTSAVATRFEVSRGLAFAVTLSGASIAAIVFPSLARYLVDTYGWRSAFVAEGAIWAVVVFPIIFFFFRGARDKQRGRAAQAPAPVQALTGMGVREGLTSLVFIRLFIACLLFTFTIIALVYHFIPLLTERGADRAAAAGVASFIGIFSMVGRLGTGFLLDRMRASLVGAAVFLLPIIACVLLFTAGASTPVQIAAACIIGLTLGSEVDVIVYLTTRHFGLKNFGTLYGGMLLALSLGTAFGPLAAAQVYDQTGNYNAFLTLTIVCMAGSALALVSLPQPTFGAVKKD